MIAEIVLPAPSRVPAVGLQWGRDPMIAEIREPDARLIAAAPASMGPRSYDRGNHNIPVSEAGAAKLLQWGRDPMIAEMPRISMPVVAAQKLQWGRDPMIAEILYTSFGL